MPKFSKKCSNPSHDDWVKDVGNIKLIDLRARGLGEVLNALKKIVTASGRVRPDKINPTICNLCLKKLTRKREFTRNLSDAERSTVQNKVCVVIRN